MFLGILIIINSFFYLLDSILRDSRIKFIISFILFYLVGKSSLIKSIIHLRIVFSSRIVRIIKLAKLYIFNI